MNLSDKPRRLKPLARRRRFADRPRGVLRGRLSPALRAAMRMGAQVFREGVRPQTYH